MQEARRLFLDVHSSLNRISYSLPQKATQARQEQTDSGPEDQFVPQSQTDEPIYKLNRNWLRTPSDNTRVDRLMQAPIGKPVAKEEDKSPFNLTKLVTNLTTAITDLSPLVQKLPALAGLTALLRTAVVVIPNILTALANGDETAVKRHCTDLGGQMNQLFQSLAKGGSLGLTPELAKVGAKAAPVFGLVVGAVDMGMDLYNSHSAPAGSEEERCWQVKTTLDAFATGASALEIVSGPLMAVSAGVALAFAMGSMIVGQYAGGLKEARNKPKR